METKTSWYLHVDLDAFFASVEQLDHPEYKGKPVIVGGKPEDKRSVVSTASYEARKFGVHSAMPTFMAYKLCPQGIFLHGRMKRYSELSYQIMSIFKEYSPDVEQMSIDEAFIDITGTERLFGPPEETALKIKEQVKKYTGLTVSVGLATTKYLAKIASGFSKPDGFYFIKPGTEQDFMLNLPLEKVWGVGKKTLELLKKTGFYTTRDIYEKNYDALEFMFGKNTATFLYNIVRGIDVVNFGHEVKKHSISAENTFIEDIKDKYTAETQLMELCQGVIFRLLKENSFSRTAFLKIRYDDFTTVSIQETVEQNILTLDTYFEIIKNLFEKKYEVGRGIRLLGVGFDNIEKEDRPFQQDLFITTNRKKQAVEKAILKLEKKHPEIKIHKARTLNKTIKSIVFLILSSFFLFSPKKLFAKDISKTENAGAGTVYTDSFIPPQDKTETEQINDKKNLEALFIYDINDENSVEFLVSGYWQSEISSSVNLSFGNETPTTFGIGFPIFTQEIDLSTWILLNQQWYFEADFADNFDKNTIAIGYDGNGILKSARLSNRGIKMPSIYSSSVFNYNLPGGNNQSPGLSAHFSDIDNSRWQGDFIIRYDMTKSNNATFYGKNSVTDTNIQPNDFIYGKTFIFPQSVNLELGKIKSIYVENKNGTFTDKNGKKFKKLSSTEYSIIQSASKIVFSQSAETQKTDNKIPTIILTFTENNSISKIISETGSYQDLNSFAGQIQQFFNSFTDKQIDLSKFTYNLETEIDNQAGLQIQNSILFSPFLCANTYDCGLSTKADLFIQSSSTEKQSKDYYAEEITTDISTIPTDFLLENHLYAQVSNNNYTDKSLQKPENRYPFADTLPEIYLNLPFEQDLSLVVRNYSEVSSFQIGTDAIEGTVQAYINDKIDYDAKYNSETGDVELSKQVSQTDKIYIVWQEDSSNYTGGALALGSGIFLNLNKNLFFDISLTSHLPLSINENYSTVDSPLSSFTALTSGLTYETNSFLIQDKLAFSLNSENSSDNLLVLEQNEQIPETYYLGNADGYVTNSQPSLSRFGINLLQKNNCTIKKHGGQTDSKITGYKIPLEYDFSTVDLSNSSNTEPYWAAVDVKLENGNLLNKSSNLELAIQNQNSQNSNIQVFLQLGINANSSFYGEDVDNIPTWNLTENDNKVISELNKNSNQWQTVLISLSDDDRARLASNSDARLIVVFTPKNSELSKEQTKSTIYFGPYEPLIKSIFINQNNAISTNSYNELCNSMPSKSFLGLTESYASKISWKIEDFQKAQNNSKISGSSYFESADFSKYKNINLDFATTTSGEINISLKNENETAVNLTLLDTSTFSSNFDSPNFHKLSINTETKKVAIDDNILDENLYILEIFTQQIPNKLCFAIDSCCDGCLVEKGQFYLGNLYYSQTETYMNVQNYFHAKFQKDDTVLSINDYAVLKDPFISITSMQTLSSISGDANIGFTLTDIRYEADFSSNYNGGHSIQTTENFPNFLQFSETYRFSKNNKSLAKTDKIGINFENQKLPININLETNATDINKIRTQTSQIENKITAQLKNSTIGMENIFEANQKINTNKNNILNFNTNNYFDGWYDISTMEFSTGNPNASSRNQKYSIKLFTNFTNNSFSPEFLYNLESKYLNITEASLQDITTLKLILPFFIKKNNFSFELGRIANGIKLTQNGGSYISDFQAISDSYSTKQWIYTSIPFYDLFDNSLYKKINNSGKNDLSSGYETFYQFEWKRKLTNTVKDFFLPSATTLAFSRNLKSNGTTLNQNDLYQIKCVISTTALNCFGKQSNLHIFNWYNQDEILSSLTGIIKIPTDMISSPTFTISAYNQNLFYITKDSILKTGIDYSLETNLDWNLRNTIVWTRPGESSFITEIINHFIKTPLTFEIKRNDILNLSIGKKNKLLNQKYEFNHNTDFKFKKYYAFTTGIGTILGLQENLASLMSITLSIGAKVNF